MLLWRFFRSYFLLYRMYKPHLETCWRGLECNSVAEHLHRVYMDSEKQRKTTTFSFSFFSLSLFDFSKIKRQCFSGYLWLSWNSLCWLDWLLTQEIPPGSASQALYAPSITFFKSIFTFCVGIALVCLVPLEAISYTGVNDTCKPPCESSVRTAKSLNYWAISPAPNVNNLLRISNKLPQYFSSCFRRGKRRCLVYFRWKSAMTVIKHLQIKFQFHPFLTSITFLGGAVECRG